MGKLLEKQGITRLFCSLKEAQQLFFYFEKHVQRTSKPPCTHFQTCWDFMSRLKPKSESGGTKIWKSVKGGV